jgi:hypothetical protein
MRKRAGSSIWQTVRATVGFLGFDLRRSGAVQRLPNGAERRPVKGKPGEVVTPLQATPVFKRVAAGGTDIIAVEA